ncbi:MULTISPECIES: hypothetical protein [Ferrimonas]|uniref:hypothetical protein n=1 Tax=Ferrimonas TaxID=44011 RepID=UPI0009FD4BDE|nr:MULTISPECIES: hypothetical protein [Ferrimonas]USD37978.1 hypothetical protein J8Z22_02055 [Ferrimonas sp. SCSIO 43195]
MKRYSTDKDINLLVHQLLYRQGWTIRRGRHPVLIAPSGKRLAVPSTPGSPSSYLNFRLEIRRLQRE